jgi:hypothetical protein
MISKTLERELRRALENNKYEITAQGIFLPQAKSEIVAGGVFEHCLNGGPWTADPNLLPTEGRNAMLDIALGATTKLAGFYIVPFATNTAPTDALTAANYDSTQTEFDNYVESSRRTWTPAAAASGVVTNAATPVSITIDDATGPTNVNIYGLGLIGGAAGTATKHATSGKLIACTLFTNPRLNLQETDILGLRYTITLTSS